MAKLARNARRDREAVSEQERATSSAVVPASAPGPVTTGLVGTKKVAPRRMPTATSGIMGPGAEAGTTSVMERRRAHTPGHHRPAPAACYQTLSGFAMDRWRRVHSTGRKGDRHGQGSDAQQQGKEETEG